MTALRVNIISILIIKSAKFSVVLHSKISRTEAKPRHYTKEPIPSKKAYHTASDTDKCVLSPADKTKHTRAQKFKTITNMADKSKNELGIGVIWVFTISITLRV